MPYAMKENSGSIFKNDKKTEDKHPGGQGKCLIEGVEYYVSSWTRENPKGKWQSLAFKRVDQKADTYTPLHGKPVQKGISTPDNFDDLDPPF